MRNDKYILSLDEGTTNAKAIVWDSSGKPCGIGYDSFPQYFPYPGWVEHDPEEIWFAQKNAMNDAIASANIGYDSIRAIGITNQRETTVLWDKNTGKPIYNAIVWQDRRTSPLVDELKKNYNIIKDKTGLIPDPYFSAFKIKWLLTEVPKARELAKNNDLNFGTIDSWLLWKLSGGKLHMTDYTNASRTMLFNINTLEWDDELLAVFKIPNDILPEVRPSSFIYGYSDKAVTKVEIPIASMIGDQQSALVGQLALSAGESKNTYGTGSFFVVNTGDKPRKTHNLVTTIAYSFQQNKVSYAIEGSVFVAGAAVQWLKDGLKLFKNSDDVESMAKSVSTNNGVYFVPALTGLGAPYWDPYARGLVIGITRDTTQAVLARSALESIAYQTNDVLRAIREDVNLDIKELNVDGSVATNDFLMQFQADISNLRVKRPKILEITSRGAGFMAGIATDFWGIPDLIDLCETDKIFYPRMKDDERSRLYNKWRDAVERSRNWAKDL